uniref:Peptidase M41 domain-containing protein n=1 Tax=Globodera pallida TaxID=36090 RepID=A0A183CI56_GLOPA
MSASRALMRQLNELREHPTDGFAVRGRVDDNKCVKLLNETFEQEGESYTIGEEGRTRVLGFYICGVCGRQRYERARTSIHESGHVFGLWFVEEAAELIQVTIVEDSAGSTTSEGREYVSRKQLFANIMLKLAGKIAEELFFGNYSAGCRSDLEQARAFATKITIVPVGQVLGSVTSEGRINCSRKQMFANIMLKYGGKCAEEIFFGTSSAGCRADMQEARAFAMELTNTRRGVHEVLADAEQRTRDRLDKDDMRTNLKKAIY